MGKLTTHLPEVGPAQGRSGIKGREEVQEKVGPEGLQVGFPDEG
jgi:hypothetical protein